MTRDKFAAILYPLVESCLPEDLLRAWERHRIVPVAPLEENAKPDRLSHLIIFLRGEVESKERISLARSGFIDQTKKIKKDEKSQDISTATAAGLFIQSKGKSKCVFCDNQRHFSSKCYIGKKMTLDERRKIVEKEKACNICLGRGHEPKNCKMKSTLKCNNCEGNHWQLMCQEKPKETNNTSVSSNLAASEKEIVEVKTRNLLAKQHSVNEVAVLSTLMVRIRNGKETLIVRAAIDSGSHKTYLLKSLIKKLGLMKIGEERLTHELFGGYQIKETLHGRYTVLVENLDGTSSQSFDVLEQNRICHNVPKLPKGPWIEELKAKGIELTDFGTGSSEIELLIGTNVAGKLLTNLYKFNESSSGYGLVAINYTIGWALMGQISYHQEVSDATSTLLVQTLFVQEIDESRLWRLDIIGIEDAAQTKKKERSIETVVKDL